MSVIAIASLAALAVFAASLFVGYLGIIYLKRKREKERRKWGEIADTFIENPPKIMADRSFNDKSLTGGFYM